MGVVSGQVWEDVNLNQAFDMGIDNPLAGVELILTLNDPSGAVVNTTTTDVDGNYSMGTGRDPAGGPGGTGQTLFCLLVNLDSTWDIVGFYEIGVQNYAVAHFFDPQTINFPFIHNPNTWMCVRIMEKWVRKVCYNAAYGIRVTFAGNAPSGHTNHQKGHHQGSKGHKAKKGKHAKAQHQHGQSAKQIAQAQLTLIKRTQGLTHTSSHPKSQHHKKPHIPKGSSQKAAQAAIAQSMHANNEILFSCIYPDATLTEYNALVASADKGHWIHQFFYKKRTYIPCATSP